MSADTAHGNRADVRFVAVGVGLDIRMLCMGCGQARTTQGSKGKGIRLRCGVCVAARAERRRGQA